MNTRPEILFPLFAELNTLTGVGDKSAMAIAGLTITKPRDLIFTLRIRWLIGAWCKACKA